MLHKITLVWPEKRQREWSAWHYPKADVTWFVPDIGRKCQGRTIFCRLQESQVFLVWVLGMPWSSLSLEFDHECDLFSTQSDNCSWWPEAPVLVRGDGVMELLEQLIQDLLRGYLQKRQSQLLGSGGIRSLPPNLCSRLGLTYQLKLSVGTNKMFFETLQKWQENGITSSAKGRERLNHCGRWTHWWSNMKICLTDDTL